MPTIEFRDVHKAYGRHEVVPSFSLSVPHGAFVVMLGPSGCGKSTVLRMLAGLEKVSRGRILIGGREVQDETPSARGCAMVFQNYALYPHMNVSDNIGYALKLAGVPAPVRQSRIGEVARMLDLTELLARRPGQLSGGQRQRVAIARAIAREPSVLLFDEPLSNLDARLRGETRLELAALHRRIGATSIYVTHDQVEAMTLADVIVVMNRGRIEQIGSPSEIYEAPTSVFVAQFVGAPPMNLLEAQSDGESVRLHAAAAAEDGVVGRLAGPARPIRLGVRPEAIRLAPGGIEARLANIERHGREVVHALDTAFGRVVSVQPEDGIRRKPGDHVGLEIDWRKACAFDPDAAGGRRIDAFRAV